MTHRRALLPPSLVAHFDAPNDYRGLFGWICGFSADAPFLAEAAERFAVQSRSHLEQEGTPYLALMLDPGAKPIGINQTPGVVHLPLREKRPFRLMHAKVALLGFQHAGEPKRWLVRLVVSTGNWTRQTVEDSLDLVWTTSVSSDDLADATDDTRLNCSDVYAAAHFMEWLEKRYNDSVLSARSVRGDPSASDENREHVRGWLKHCRRAARGEPRFMDNRRASFLDQLPTKISACSKAVRRNYLAFGSGFYEAASQPPVPVAVPQAIVETLRRDHLTGSGQIDLFVNPLACQAVASSITALREVGITVRAAASPAPVFGKSSTRTLHAKFMFGANHTHQGNCRHPWVYLGSGNFTSAGFLHKANANSGNLETGVVFDPGPVSWVAGNGIPPESVITNLLPIDWKSAVLEDSSQLEAGEVYERDEHHYVGLPLTCLTWHPASSTATPAELRWRAGEAPDDDVQVIDPHGNPCRRSEQGVIWIHEEPREIEISWTADGVTRGARIPVIDAYGRVGATARKALDLDGMLAKLNARHGRRLQDSEDEDADDENGSVDGDGRAEVASPRLFRKSTVAEAVPYPIRRMMAWVEDIARHQTSLSENDWTRWCVQFESLLEQGKDDACVAYFRDTLRMNPLSPLLAPPFRPDFALDDTSPHGRRYEDALVRIAHVWGVHDLTAITAGVQ